MESTDDFRGFSIVELLVVVAIITIITGITLSSQGSFNKTLILSNTAYDIALTIRSAETYGLASRATEGAVVNAGYGVHFERATSNAFTFFVDTYPSASLTAPCHPASDLSSPAAKPGDCAYDADQGEKIISYTLGNGITVSDFCAYAESWSCANSNGSALTSLDIVFARPNPDPYMTANGSYSSGSPVTQACFTLVAPQGGSRSVSIKSTGAVDARATSCP